MQRKSRGCESSIQLQRINDASTRSAAKIRDMRCNRKIILAPRSMASIALPVKDKQDTGTFCHEKHRNGITVMPNEATDIQRWRLLDEQGRQTWHYLETDEEAKAWPQSIADRYHLGLPLVGSVPNSRASECSQLTDQDVLGPARASTTHDSSRLRSKCPLLLLSPTAPTR